jgi:hypothetical protein
MPKKETNFYYNAQHFEIIKTNTDKASQYKINIDDFDVIVLIGLNPYKYTITVQSPLFIDIL